MRLRPIAHLLVLTRTTLCAFARTIKILSASLLAVSPRTDARSTAAPASPTSAQPSPPSTRPPPPPRALLRAGHRLRPLRHRRQCGELVAGGHAALHVRRGAASRWLAAAASPAGGCTLHWPRSPGSTGRRRLCRPWAAPAWSPPQAQQPRGAGAAAVGAAGVAAT